MTTDSTRDKVESQSPFACKVPGSRTGIRFWLFRVALKFRACGRVSHAPHRRIGLLP